MRAQGPNTRLQAGDASDAKEANGMHLRTITMIGAALFTGAQLLIRRAEAHPVIQAHAVPFGAIAEQTAVPAAQGFDVASLRIGQDEASALAALKAQGYSVTTVTLSHRWQVEAPRSLRIQAVKHDTTAPVLQDGVIVWLSYPPDKSRVLGIYRSLEYGRKGAPTLISFMNAAKAKAGFEVSRQLPNVYVGAYEGEQLIRWRPDGKRISALGKLFSNLSRDGARDPCVAPFAVAPGYASPVDELDYARMSTVAFYPDRAKRDDVFGLYDAFFAPSPTCGTTFTSFIRQDRPGFAQEVRLLLADQSAMHRNAAAYHRWWRERSAEDRRRRTINAGRPDV